MDQSIRRKIPERTVGFCGCFLSGTAGGGGGLFIDGIDKKVGKDAVFGKFRKQMIR